MTAAAATASRRRTDAGTDLPLLALSEVALLGVTLAAVIGLRRAFLGSEWFWPLALQAIAAHAVPAALRRRGLPVTASIVAAAALGALAVTWIYAGEHTAFGLPTGASVDALLSALGDAAEQFSEVKAPTEALPGFLIATSLAVWMGAAVADWATFRVDAPLEATLPSATLFIIAAIFGADIDRVLLAGLWVSAVLMLLLLRRAERLGRVSTWVGERRRSGPRAMVLGGAALVGLAVLAGSLSGGQLPGGSGQGVVDLLDLDSDGPGSRVTVSPLVDIRSRLREQSDVELFTVRSPVPAYWRLTSLERFDGGIWSSNGSYGSADGDLDDGVPVDSPRITFEQSYVIGALAQIWMPAAYEPMSISASADTRYDEMSGTIIVDTDIESSDGVEYRVTSALPEHQPEALSAASEAVPDDIADTYLELPGDFPDSVREQARAITDGATSRYEQALRLQEFFRSDAFTYDLDANLGTSDDAMVQFLAEGRGFCQQFAGTYAAMARSLGIPARVAVGFSPGDRDPADPELYRVRGRYAHAWPEVYLGEYGWVLFEPTPERGAPYAEQYTGVPAQQAAADGGPGGVEVPPATTAVPQDDVPQPELPDRPLPELPEDSAVDTVDESSDEPLVQRWLRRGAIALAVAAGLVAVYALVVLAVTQARRLRREHAAIDPPDKVALAWDELLGAVSRAGISVRPAETPREVAGRVGARLPALEAPLRTLAITVQDSTFAPIAPSAEIAEQALVLAREIEAATTAAMTPGERLRARFHPRRLLGR